MAPPKVIGAIGGGREKSPITHFKISVPHHNKNIPAANT